FLSPEPLRGKTNEPKNVRIIAEFLAHLRSQPIDKIIGVSADNAKRLFGI
ncbi:MAG: Hydrolase, TatD family, partial [Candidatus Curtissbacteria bacterium GW2011_GWA1_40_24]